MPREKRWELWTAVSGLLALISRAYHNFSLWHQEFIKADTGDNYLMVIFVVIYRVYSYFWQYVAIMLIPEQQENVEMNSIPRIILYLTMLWEENINHWLSQTSTSYWLTLAVKLFIRNRLWRSKELLCFMLCVPLPVTLSSVIAKLHTRRVACGAYL